MMSAMTANMNPAPPVIVGVGPVSPDEVIAVARRGGRQGRAAGTDGGHGRRCLVMRICLI